MKKIFLAAFIMLSSFSAGFADQAPVTVTCTQNLRAAYIRVNSLEDDLIIHGMTINRKQAMNKPSNKLKFGGWVEIKRYDFSCSRQLFEIGVQTNYGDWTFQFNR